MRHHLFAELGASPRAIAEQMGWSLAGTLNLLAVHGTPTWEPLRRSTGAFGTNVAPLRVADAV